MRNRLSGGVSRLAGTRAPGQSGRFAGSPAAGRTSGS